MDHFAGLDVSVKETSVCIVAILHRRLLAVVRDDDVCRRLMTVLVSVPW
jgi:hypothetical protein